MSKIPVDHYGIHWSEGDVAFMHQSQGGANAVGLKLPTPFQVNLSRKSVKCNHNLPMTAPKPNGEHVEFLLQNLKDPLVEAMLPLPKDEESTGVYYLEDDDNKFGMIIRILLKMSAPIHAPVYPIWMLTIPKIIDELSVTNVQPLVLTNVMPEHTDKLEKIAQAAPSMPRILLLTGSSSVVVPQGIEVIKSSMDQYMPDELVNFPWEILGAFVVRKYMQHKWPLEPNQPY